jgi:hypothetical protein
MAKFKLSCGVPFKSKKKSITDHRTTIDPTLVQAGELLGSSYMPGEIDYKTPKIELFPVDIPEKDPEKSTERTSKWNWKRAKTRRKLEKKKKNTGYEDVPQYWQDSSFTLRQIGKIFNNAIPNGKVQQELINRGFDPLKQA